VNFSLKLANSNDAIVYESKKEEFDLQSENEDSSDDEEEPEAAFIKSPYCDEKSAAICALGHFANAAPI
jgi:hypothetical protein